MAGIWHVYPPEDVELVEEFTGAGPQTSPVRELRLLGKEKRWGWEVLFTDPASPITGKVLFRKGDPTYEGLVQYHPARSESFYLLSGRCLLRWDPGDGSLRVEEVEAGRAFHVPALARHSIIALTDCIFVEVSSASGAISDRVDVDAEYRGDAR